VPSEYANVAAQSLFHSYTDANHHADRHGDCADAYTNRKYPAYGDQYAGSSHRHVDACTTIRNAETANGYAGAAHEHAIGDQYTMIGGSGLVLTYWLHILATVVWIGGLTSLSIFVLPAAKKTLPAEEYSKFLSLMQKRMQPISWLCLVTLIFTGLFQLVTSPNYQGFLVIANTWAQAILIKHIAVGGMLGLSAYVTWGLIPSLNRMAFMQAMGKDIDEAQKEKLEQRQLSIMQINLFLAVIILLLTAWARTS